MVGKVIDTHGVNPDLVMTYATGVGMRNETRDILQQRNMEFFNNVSQFNQEFANTVLNEFKINQEAQLQQQANQVLARSNHILINDRIHEVSYNNIGDAGMRMRSYIMSDPVIYNMYEHARCSGYEDMWLNTEPDVEPHWRDDYLQVIDGSLDPYKDHMHVRDVYLEVEPLRIDERSIVRDAWETSRDLLLEGYDPTSPDKDKI